MARSMSSIGNASVQITLKMNNGRTLTFTSVNQMHEYFDKIRKQKGRLSWLPKSKR